MVYVLSFSAFYKSFGLTSFPFDTYTTDTEQELEYTKKLFVAQGEYDPIIVTGMERTGLIENANKKQQGTLVYRVKDPKIVYALEKWLEIKK